MLGVRSVGTGPPLVALHGFTHTSEQFVRLAAHLDRTVHAVDLPGHGDSAGADTDFPSVLDAIADVVARIDPNPVPVLGYSQGARLALATALDRPDLVADLVLVSGSAGIADDAARHDRAGSDAALARAIRRQGVGPFLARWTASGITSTTHRTDDERRLDLERRSVNSAEGLARALEGYGQGAMPSRWESLDRLESRTLLIVGEGDARYLEIARSMARRMPVATVRVVPGAGHDPIGDAVDVVAAVVSGFLDGDR